MGTSSWCQAGSWGEFGANTERTLADGLLREPCLTAATEPLLPLWGAVLSSTSPSQQEAPGSQCDKQTWSPLAAEFCLFRPLIGSF